MVRGGTHTTDVIMRKRSENRGYTDENIRDSIVMGELSSKFPDLGKLQSTAEVRIRSNMTHEDLALASWCKEAFPAVCSSAGSSAGKLRNPSSVPMGRGCGRLIHSDFAGATLTLAVSPSLPLSSSPSPFPHHPFLPISPVSFIVSLFPPLCTPLSSSVAFPLFAQRALRWVQLRWDAEQFAQPVQLQPASGLEGQETVVRCQRSAL